MYSVNLEKVQRRILLLRKAQNYIAVALREKKHFLGHKVQYNKYRIAHIVLKNVQKCVVEFLGCFSQVNIENYKGNIKNELLKEYFLTSYTFFPSLWQYTNTATIKFYIYSQ